mgnify:CR=1 FL=1
MYKKGEMELFQRKKASPDFTLAQNLLLIRLWKIILDHRTEILFRNKIFTTLHTNQQKIRKIVI